MKEKPAKAKKSTNKTDSKKPSGSDMIQTTTTGIPDSFINPEA